MTIAHVPHFEFVHNPQSAATVGELIDANGYEYLINATFFHYEVGVDGVDVQHVGHLYLDGVLYPSKEMDIIDQLQLTHIAQYDPSIPQLMFIDANTFTSAEDPTIEEFQSGPLVIENNEIRMDLIESAINGMGPYPRTLLATINHEDIYFITVRERASLEKVAEVLLTLDIFAGQRLDVFNLDGGLSTYLYSTAQPELNHWSYNTDPNLYNETEPTFTNNAEVPMLEVQLPYYLGVR